MCAAGSGAPHIRQRLYWVADAGDTERGRRPQPSGKRRGALHSTDCGRIGRLANGEIERRESGRPIEPRNGRDAARSEPGGLCVTGGAANATDERFGKDGCAEVGCRKSEMLARAGTTDTWSDYDIIPCRDGKSRRIERGTFPLVARLPDRLGHGSDQSVPITEAYAQATAEARVMRLRGYGNAIVPQVAAMFVKAFLDATVPRGEK